MRWWRRASTHAFCVPGESYLDLLDGLYAQRNRIELVTCRFEAGAVHMAEAYGKLTGKPGVAIVTRGPGACHAAIGVHVAFQDSTPLVLFIGQIPFEETDRETLPGSRLPQDVRPARQMGDADRRRRAHPGD